MSTDEYSKNYYSKNADKYTEHVRNTTDSVYHAYYEKPAMYKLLPPLNGKVVLSVGCGSGDLLAKIDGSRKVGIDFSEEYIIWAKEKHQDKNMEFLFMDANEIKLNEKFDLIIISNLIGFVDDIQNVFEQIKKVSHPNTKVIVQYYNSYILSLLFLLLYLLLYPFPFPCL